MKILIVASNMVHIKNFHLPYIQKFKDDGHDVYVMASGDGADLISRSKNVRFHLKIYPFHVKSKKY